MMFRQTFFQWLWIALTISSAGAFDAFLIPEPVMKTVGDETAFQLPVVSRFNCTGPVPWKRHLQIVATHIQQITGGKHRLIVSDSSAGAIPVAVTIDRDSNLASEAYRLSVRKDGIKLTASTLKGLAHATATLLQLVGASEDGNLPDIRIDDAPGAAYRSFMIDMGRNPISLALLKETIDLSWYYKVDSLHLHLTDDQRFAFPSKAFPKLWDGKITLEQFRELESYALDRGVTLIPELEIPGHSGLIRHHYPEVFGKTATDLANSETAWQGITKLLDEMMDVFSSSYIHVGGDEAFGVPEDSQRSLINRLNTYLKSKGRQTLVWEGPGRGIGDNKVDTDVVHINWRTINYPADEMIDDGYSVVNAAWDPLYLVDHYPRTNFTMTSPQHLFETMRLTRFKHVNPAIATFANPIETGSSDQLIGFCMPWWEGREENFLSQTVPRFIPFAAVAWNRTVERDFNDFRSRQTQTEAMRRKGFYGVEIVANPLAVAADGVFHHQTQVTLRSNAASDSRLYYTLDGSEPRSESTRYTEPFMLTKSATVRATLFDGEQQVGHGSRLMLTKVVPVSNLALGKSVHSSATTGPPFSVGRITDGDIDNLGFYLGYPAQPEPITLTIDLEKPTTVGRIVVHAYTISGSFESYSLEVSSDGSDYDQVASRTKKPESPLGMTEHRFDPRVIQFVRLKSNGNIGYVFDSFSKFTEVQVFTN